MVDTKLFRILAKNSASPTILIINKKNNSIMKIWDYDEKTDETEGLRYENAVYKGFIKPLLEKNSKLPLLKYFGSCRENTTVTDLLNVLGIKNKSKDFESFAISLDMFFLNTRGSYTYSEDELKDYVKSTNIDLDKLMSHKISCIILPIDKLYNIR